MIQFTSPITALVPIVATAVCATVLIARTILARNQSFVNTLFTDYHPFKKQFATTGLLYKSDR
jgi:hypothetical protein